VSRRQQQRLKQARAQYDADLQWVMAHEQGRRFVNALCEDVGLDTVSPFTGNSATFYKIGQQDLVRGLVNHLRRVALADVRRMEDEALQAKQFAAQIDQLPDDPPEA
jgi:hypothetical protein